MRILVIEDSEKHTKDGMEYSRQLIGCTVDFATTLYDAMLLLQKHSYEGVISDVFFPAEVGAPAVSFENALAINSKLVDMGIHHVFNTAGNHHGKKYQGFLHKTPRSAFNGGTQIYNNDFMATGMIIEAYPEGDPGSEKDTKQWEAAFRYVLLVKAFREHPDEVKNILEDNWHGDGSNNWLIFEAFPYGDYGKLTERFQMCSLPFVVSVFKQFNA